MTFDDIVVYHFNDVVSADSMGWKLGIVAADVEFPIGASGEMGSSNVISSVWVCEQFSHE